MLNSSGLMANTFNHSDQEKEAVGTLTSRIAWSTFELQDSHSYRVISWWF